jgi:hypothetical protein
LARDWYADRAGVLQRIERLLAGLELEEPDEDEELLPGETGAASEEDVSAASSPTMGVDNVVEPVTVAQAGKETSQTDEGVAAILPTDSAAPVQSDGESSTWSDHLEYVEGDSSKFGRSPSAATSRPFASAASARADRA